MSNAQRDACGGGVATDSKVADRAGNPTEVGGSSDISLEKYKMDHKRRGLALIFNQENFDCPAQLPMKPRHGTNADRRNLEERLKALNFEVQAHTDLKKEEVLEKIRKAAEADHVDEDCFLCVFLTHGEEDMIYAHDKGFSIKDITAFFKGDKCQSLVGKPKIFIFQACRGKEYDNDATGMAAGEPEENQVVMDAGVVHTLPAGADFLMCYSTAEGYYSFRHPVDGSWFIQDLCQTLQRSAGSLEFLELLTLVNMKVSRRTVERAADHNAIGKKQIPCFASMLTKQLYF